MKTRTLTLVLMAGFGLLTTPQPSFAADAPTGVPSTSLFNGKDLTGWAPMNDGVFTVTNGNIHIAGGMGWLRTERTYTNFIFEAEWRALEPGYNSGFFVRAVSEGKPFPNDGWQANLKESALGSLLKGSNTVVQSTTPKVPVNEWHKFRMEVSGKKFVLHVDGRKACEFSELDSPSGHLGLQAEGKAFDFRNLQVQELP